MPGAMRGVRITRRYAAVFALVVCASAVGSFFLGRHLLSSGGQATADNPDDDPAVIATRRALLEESERLLAEDKAKPRFAGELGDYFFIGNASTPIPPEWEFPLSLRETCREDTVVVAVADTELYAELPASVGNTKVTLSGPPQGQLCAGQFTWVEQHGTVDTIFGPASGSIQVSRLRLYQSRYAFYFDAPRDRLRLTSISGKPALVVSPVGPTDATHVNVIERPVTADRPGVVLSVGGDLSTEEVIKLAEELARTD